VNASAKLIREGKTLVIRVPLPPQRRGRRKLVIGPGEVSWTGRRAVIGTTVIKALARAHRWKAILESGEHASLTELAKAEKITLSYLCRVLRLTLLAPDIVEEILSGHFAGPQLSDLLQPLPTIWDEQRKMLPANVAPD
jgi:hypothetical protein